MNVSLAKNYAEALFSIGNEKNNFSMLQEQMKEIKEVIIENADLISILSSYFMSNKEKDGLIEKVFSSFDEDIVSLIKILNKNHRIKLLNKVIEEFNSLCNEKKGIMEGLIYSIYPLNKEQIEKIENKISTLEKVPCEFKNLIDSTLIGGIKVVVNGHIYDGSIVSKIESLRSTLIK